MLEILVEEFSYVLAWMVYLIGATGLTVVFWRMTRNIRLRRTRRALRSLVAALFFTPFNMTFDGGTWLVPAYLVGGYDWVLGNVDQAIQAGLYVSAAYCLLIFCIFFESVMRRLLGMERAA